MAITTIGGILVADLILSAGTYQVTSPLTFGGKTVTIDPTEGDVVIKGHALSAPSIFLLNGTGSLVVSASDTYKVYVTSLNDDTVGEEYAFSTHSPEVGDLQIVWSVSGLGATVNVAGGFEVRYAYTVNEAPLNWSTTVPSTSNNVTLKKVTLKNCRVDVPVFAAANTAFIGQTDSIQPIGNVLIEDLKIDNTCTIVETAASHAPAIRFIVNESFTLERASIEVAGNPRSAFVVDTAGTDGTISIKDLFARGSFAYELFNVNANDGMIGTIDRAVAISTHPDPEGVMAYAFYITNAGAGDVSISAADCLAYFDVDSPSIPVWTLETYDTGVIDFWANNCASYHLGEEVFAGEYGGTITDVVASSLSADPLFLSASEIVPLVTILSGCIFPDGYFATEPQYDEAGYRTLAAAGLPTTYSPTGKIYTSADKTSPGVSYLIELVPVAPTYPSVTLDGESVTLVSQSVNGADNVVVYISSSDELRIKRVHV